MNNFINEVCIKWQKDLDNAILGEIKRKAIEHGIKTEYLLNEKAIINALEKQIPKKPNYKSDYLMHFCPICDFPLPLCFKFCNHCGQALDWSENDERY